MPSPVYGSVMVWPPSGVIPEQNPEQTLSTAWCGFDNNNSSKLVTKERFEFGGQRGIMPRDPSDCLVDAVMLGTQDSCIQSICTDPELLPHLGSSQFYWYRAEKQDSSV